ncbi:conserved hypothetical protein (plasmid) [Burkholderia vietnamiensis G4]|uniref:Uncharacterized protein n=1 Tax=Burkholderia vietnamiensis (strain G4 / LMG 22486) TaxID=269482 RepID=A4JTY8_BURVG|nr:conserved hypothetical protein [Burkholderia vietnamiensis G4]
MPAQDPLPIHPSPSSTPHQASAYQPLTPPIRPDRHFTRSPARESITPLNPSPANTFTSPSPPASAHRYPVLDRAQSHLAQSLASAHPAQPDPPPADTLTPPIPPADPPTPPFPQPHNHLARSPVDKTPTPPSPPPAATSLRRHPPPADTTLHPISRQQKSHCARSLAWPSDHPANPHLPLRRVGSTTAPSLTIPSHRSHRTGPRASSAPPQT